MSQTPNVNHVFQNTIIEIVLGISKISELSKSGFGPEARDVAIEIRKKFELGQIQYQTINELSRSKDGSETRDIAIRLGKNFNIMQEQFQTLEDLII